MKIVCAWCSRVIGGRGAALSHGICRHCFQDLFQEQFEFVSKMPARRALAGRHRRRGHSRHAAPGLNSQMTLSGL